MKTFLVVHSIPSPYRLHLFCVMEERLRLRNVGFHVHFLAHQHEDFRHWRQLPLPSFSHTFWRDRGVTLGKNRCYFHPSLVFTLSKICVDYLMIGGIWNSPTVLILTAFARRNVGIGWIEGNTTTPGRIGGFFWFLKRWAIKRYRFLAVPGTEGRRYVNLFERRKGEFDSVLLPNIVDEKLFAFSDAAFKRGRNSLQMGEDEKIAVCSARLVPVKGLIEYVSAMTSDILGDCRIIIVGDGPLKERINRLIKERSLSGKINIMPSVPYEQMSDIYAAADVFLLPSLQDMNPVSVVEALHSGLPLLVSNRIGNCCDALEEGVNGWSFNPIDMNDVVNASRRAFRSSRQELAAMGEFSRKIALDFWDSTSSVESFIGSVL
ncbi:glycosyltransferase family 4 protein [Verrucomicrobiota bacterium]